MASQKKWAVGEYETGQRLASVEAVGSRRLRIRLNGDVVEKGGCRGFVTALMVTFVEEVVGKEATG